MGWGWAISWVKETNYGVGLLAPLTSPPAYRSPPLHKWRGGNWVGVGLEGVLSPEWGEIARQRGRIEPRMGRDSPTKLRIGATLRARMQKA